MKRIAPLLGLGLLARGGWAVDEGRADWERDRDAANQRQMSDWRARENPFGFSDADRALLETNRPPSPAWFRPLTAGAEAQEK